MYIPPEINLLSPFTADEQPMGPYPSLAFCLCSMPSSATVITLGSIGLGPGDRGADCL